MLEMGVTKEGAVVVVDVEEEEEMVVDVAITRAALVSVTHVKWKVISLENVSQ